MSFQNFAVLAHRGCSSLAPENTLAAFAMAADKGATGVELDVSLSGDNKPVIFHDHTVERTTSGQGALDDLSLDALRTLDAGRYFSAQFAGEKIPLPDEAIDLLTKKRLDLNLEMKPRGTQATLLAAKVHEVLSARPELTTDNLLVSSFNYECLQHLRTLAPEIALAILYDEELPEHWQEQVSTIRARAVNLSTGLATAQRIDRILNSGTGVYVWTVNDPQQVRSLKACGVNGIITDKPQDCGVRWTP